MALTYSQMEPTYLRYHYLRLPIPICTDLFTALPFPNTVDKWINKNRNDSYHGSVLLPGYIAITDVPMDQVLCLLVVAAETVSLPSVAVALAIAKLHLLD